MSPVNQEQRAAKTASRDGDPVELPPFVEHTPPAVDRTPYDVAAEFIQAGGSITPEVVEWLAGIGCGPRDVGRFLRHMAIPADVLTSSVAYLSHTDRLRVRAGFLSERPPAPMPARSPDWEGRTRPSLPSDTPETRLLASSTWKAAAPQDESQKIFRFADSLAWVKAGSGESVMPITISADRLRFVLRRTIRWTNNSSREVKPPDAVVNDMLADPHPPVPRLLAVRTTPIFGPSGALAANPGYDPASQYFIWPEGITVPFVPEYPLDMDIAKARHLIETELLGDFPFDDPASKVHAIGAMILPFVRPMINGSTPLHLINKPAPGTGGTLLADVITFPALGHPPTRISVGKLEDEWRYRLLAMLQGSPTTIVFDNITVPLTSGALASALTGSTFSDRRLGSSTQVEVPVQNLWLASGNNVQMSSEIARRTVPIYLDANMEHPEEGRRYRHEHLLGWVEEHRGELIWAVLILVQAWIASGRPRAAKSLASYEKWAETIGGILDVADIPGFLTNLDRLRSESDAEGRAWTNLTSAWFKQYGSQPCGAGQLMDLAQQYLSEVLDFGSGGRSAQTKWGIALKAKRGAVFGDYKIEEAGSRSGAAQWRVTPVRERDSQNKGREEVDA